ncbi:MAG: purine-nucleoside phosphorylase [Candidatus Eremiobacteraeota bacterium]|nr:purine-nucleoside phosphorylase [Candidatus Eremiobacteraeota bacterium]
MIDRRSPNEQILAQDAHRLHEAAQGPIDIAVILGSGLSRALLGRFAGNSVPYDELLGFPSASLTGHVGQVFAGAWHGKRIAAFAGRVHLYQGFSASQVTVNVRLAHAAGARIVILTNSAGGLDRRFVPGDFMIIGDHINLTGCNPLLAMPQDNPFVDMAAAYSPRLRSIVQSDAAPGHELQEGVYAGVLGPNYETAAECRYLRTIGADAVGMSTVLETIVARVLGMEVLGISCITNSAEGSITSHGGVVERAAAAAPRLGALIDGFIAAL